MSGDTRGRDEGMYVAAMRSKKKGQTVENRQRDTS